VKPEGIRICQACGAEIPIKLGICPTCAFRRLVDEDRATSELSLTRTLSPLRFEHYELLTSDDGAPFELGRGAMGVTYKAIDINLRCPVALKVISTRLLGDEASRRRFIREARAAASIRHSNVASVFHLGTSDESFFYAMEFVEGETLDKLLRRLGRLEVLLSLNLTALVANGLDAIEKQGLIHRDIKPSNIMVSSEGDKIANAKIIDLGLAKAAAQDESASAISTEGLFLGTPAYASPEQLDGAPVDIRSDLYSLGVTLWEMITGDLPFKGTPTQLMHLHHYAPLPIEKLKSAPQPVSALLEVLLDKDPEKRFQLPTHLAKIIPVVSDAVVAKRRLTANEIRSPSRANINRLSTASRKYGRQVAERQEASGSEAPWTRAWTSFRSFFGSVNEDDRETVPIENSIAVLPFENLSTAGKDDYFADGVQDEILTNLAKIKQLRVIGRTSVMHFRGNERRDLRKIAKTLGVTTIMEGTVRRYQNQVRLNARLIDAKTGTTLWADSFDRSLIDIFAIQSEIAETVASKLKSEISSTEKRSIREMPTNNVEALDLYLRAKALIAASTISFAGGQQEFKAIRMLEDATHRDPNFTLAYCLLTRAHDYLFNSGLDKTPERCRLGDAALEAARLSRTDSPELHLAEAFHAYICYRDYQTARARLALAERVRPDSAETLLLRAAMDRRQGYWDQSTNGQKNALRLDPQNPECFRQLAYNYFFLRRYQAFEKAMDRLIELEPGKPILVTEKAYAAFAARGDTATGRNALDSLPVAEGENDEYLAMSRFNNALASRDWAETERLLNENLGGEFPFGHFVSPAALVPIACMRAWLARLRGENPTKEAQITAARNELARKVKAQPEEAYLLSVLAVIDAVCHRKEEAIAEAKRALALLPVSTDAVEGPEVARNLAIVYALTNETDLALHELAILVDTAHGIEYGELKLHPCWDSLRSDPGFEKLLTQLAPRN
jgi:serine/threonine protein kinase/Flp pilus assembly protein TadD